MYQRANTGSSQRSLDSIPLRRTHDVKVPDVFAAVDGGGQHEVEVGQQLAIVRGYLLAAGIPPVQVCELDAQHGALQRIETAVHAGDLVYVLHTRAIIAQDANAIRQIRAIGGNSASIAERAEVLARIEAPADHITVRAPPVITGAMSLRAILHDREAMLPGKGEDGVQVCGLTVEMNRQNDLSARRQSGCDSVWVDVVRPRVRLDRHRSCAALRYASQVAM